MCKAFFHPLLLGLLLLAIRSTHAAQLYWNDGNLIHRAALDGSGPQNLDPTYNASGIAANPADGLFWTDDVPRAPVGPTGTIRHADLNGMGMTDVLPGIPTPIGIALDVAHGKMYWTDSANVIHRANLDGTNVQNLINQPSIAELSGIVVDAAHDRFYFSYVNPLIESARPGGIGSANLDGSDFQIAVGSLVNPQGLGLDPAGNLYWADVDRIQRAPIGGTAQDLVTGLSRPFGLALDVADQTVFWTDSQAGLIARAPFTGGKATSVLTNLSNPTAIAIVVEASSWTGAYDTTWGDSRNWSGPVPGATVGTANTDTALFNRQAPNSPLAIESGRNVQSITFDTASVNSLTVGTAGGPALLLTAGGMVQTTATVAKPQAVNAPLVLEGDYTFTSAAQMSSSTLGFGGRITPGATSGITTLTLNGANTGANTISGVLADQDAGKLAVTKSGSGVWILSGANTYSGDTTIAGGTLKLDITSGAPIIAAGVTAKVIPGATLELAGSVSALGTPGGNRVHLVNDSAAPGLMVSGTNQLVGGVDGVGNMTVNTGSDLTADHIIQNALIIGGRMDSPSLVTIAASDATGVPLIAHSTKLLTELRSSTLNGPNGAVGNSAVTQTVGTDFLALPLGTSVAAGSPASVPEPSRLTLLSIGLIALGGMLARRRRAVSARASLCRIELQDLSFERGQENLATGRRRRGGQMAPFLRQVPFKLD